MLSQAWRVPVAAVGRGNLGEVCLHGDLALAMSYRRRIDLPLFLGSLQITFFHLLKSYIFAVFRESILGLFCNSLKLHYIHICLFDYYYLIHELRQGRNLVFFSTITSYVPRTVPGIFYWLFSRH